MTAAASAVLWTFVALMYNLIADIVGGVEVVLAEKRTSSPPIDTLSEPASTLRDLGPVAQLG